MLAHSLIVEKTPSAYPNPLRNWEDHSWIRSKPLRSGTGVGAWEGYAFPPGLVPLASHPKIVSVPKLQGQLLAYRLLAHLKFTTTLELAHVNPVCSDLAQGRSPVELTFPERSDALRIYCDEGGHALFVEQLATAFEALFNVDSRRLGEPEFDARMKRRLASEADPVMRIYLQQFFVSVS